MNHAIETLQHRLDELRKWEEEWGGRADRDWAEAQAQWAKDSALRVKRQKEIGELTVAIALLMPVGRESSDEIGNPFMVKK
mgnify:CR=1 FL=1